MKKIIAIGIGVLVLAAGGWYFTHRGDGPATSYRFVPIEKGDVDRLVTSTGTLGAVTTVQVGTQVSGALAHIFVDFNDVVKKGQPIAQIDTTLLSTAVAEARAALAQATATQRHAAADLARSKSLYDQKAISDSDFALAQYTEDSAAAAVMSARVHLQQAKQNMAYATIYAPISGIVIERDVDVGQTVAASLSAPQLFVIANDLSKMQILASVDESDIGMIHNGQTVRFTVQAYPDSTFHGTVRQVRLQSTSSENVVNYTAVVDVDNRGGKLLPGMTATVDFLVESAHDVLKVANVALRLRPTDDMIAELRARNAGHPRDSSVAGADTPRGAWRPGQVAGAGPSGGSAPGGNAPSGGWKPPADAGHLFYLDDAGKLAVARVHVGITDGTYTAIQGKDIKPGMQVIAALTAAPGATSTNPFQAQQQGGRHFGPGF